MAAYGSPPRARGKGHLVFLAGDLVGITPACAGKSPAFPVWSLRRWDHPRMRGEKFEIDTPAGLRAGSPPHARGKGLCQQPGAFCFGITPAYAGKSIPARPGCRCCRDHPRVRGEKLSRPAGERCNGGSPPRARGKVFCRCSQTRRGRITPACAGTRLLVLQVGAL